MDQYLDNVSGFDAPHLSKVYDGFVYCQAVDINKPVWRVNVQFLKSCLFNPATSALNSAHNKFSFFTILNGLFITLISMD
jgi:hypothetical protein